MANRTAAQGCEADIVTERETAKRRMRRTAVEQQPVDIPQRQPVEPAQAEITSPGKKAGE